MHYSIYGVSWFIYTIYTINIYAAEETRMTKEEKRIYDIEYRKKNKDALKQADIEYRAANAEAIRKRESQRYKNNKADILARTTQYYYNNRDSRLAYWKRHHAVNKEVRNIRSSTWRKNNQPSAKLSSARWRRAHPHTVAVLAASRKFKLMQATPVWSETVLIDKVYMKRDEYRELYGVNFEVDHIIPINSDTVCGLHVLANLQLLDKSLNGSKHNNYQSDW